MALEIFEIHDKQEREIAAIVEGATPELAWLFCGSAITANIKAARRVLGEEKTRAMLREVLADCGLSLNRAPRA
ncbi:hypothetical protein MPC4_80184 [Methylocella tundrae]|uniref:Uncharacterized protein n=1 Tax=Methylocella tundrae TaxID=227605 RepID=A0A8B6MBX6_METTU|nr:hypothetical protein [Methylocella tundrae]VTZ52513.1 hypothetical protein MPC4_80184 [Methylocella tundrae]